MVAQAGYMKWDLETVEQVLIPTNNYILNINSTGTNASLYNETFTKIVDDRSVNNLDPARNKIETRHVSGTNYTDVLVTCSLDYGEPTGQDAFDTAADTNSLYVFDELGLKHIVPVEQEDYLHM